MDVHVRLPVRPSSNDLWFLAYLPLAISDGIATPLIPLLALLRFGADAFVIAIIVAASSMSQVPLTILWGNLSDRVAHRKYFLVGSFLATGVCLIGMAFAADILGYFWINIAEGLASAASAPIGTILLLETRTKRWWAGDIGRFGLVSGVGTTAGLVVGFVWLFTLQASQTAVSVLQGLLALAGALAVLAALLALGWIEEPNRRIERRKLAELLPLDRGLWDRFRRARSWILHVVDLARPIGGRLPRREILFLAALGVMSVGFAVFYGPFPVFLVQTAGFSTQWVFVTYLGESAASTALFYHSGKAVERHSPKTVFLECLGSRFALILLFLPALFALFAVGSAGLVAWLTFLNVLMGVTWAFISTASTLFLVRLVGRSGRGRALGLYNAVSGAGTLLGTVLGGWLYVTFGVASVFGLAAFTVLAGAALLAPIPFHAFLLGQPFRRRAWRGVRAANPPHWFRRARRRP